MNVKLIDYTGMGNPDPYWAARLLVYTKSTRLTQGEDCRARIFGMPEVTLLNELAYMTKTIRSSWEFVHYTFEITGVSRAFTHQFVRTRTMSFAQQSMRSVDMNGFDTVHPPNIDGNQDYLEIWEDCIATIQASYDEMIEKGCPIQDARGLLPTNISTNIIASANLRTMSDLAGKRDNPRAQGEYTEVFKAMAGCILAVHPWADMFLYPKRLDTPALDAILADALGTANPSENQLINNALKELEGLKAIWG